MSWTPAVVWRDGFEPIIVEPRDFMNDDAREGAISLVACQVPFELSRTEWKREDCAAETMIHLLLRKHR